MPERATVHPVRLTSAPFPGQCADTSVWRRNALGPPEPPTMTV